MKKWFFFPLLLLTIVGYGQEYSSDTIETDIKSKFKAATSIKITSTAIVIQTQGQPVQTYQVNEPLHPMEHYTSWYTNDGASLSYDESQGMLIVTKTGKEFTAYYNLRLLKP